MSRRSSVVATDVESLPASPRASPGVSPGVSPGPWKQGGPLPPIRALHWTDADGDAAVGPGPPPDDLEDEDLPAPQVVDEAGPAVAGPAPGASDAVEMEGVLGHVVGAECLRLFATTWNMAGKAPPDDLSVWIPRQEFHMYAIGTQERPAGAGRRRRGRDRWEQQLQEHLSDEMVLVGSTVLGPLHLVVFLHRDLMPYVDQVRIATVATGVGNVVGNKGGAAVSLRIGGTSVAILNSHLAAHQWSVGQRNADFQRIDGEISLKLASVFEQPKKRGRRWRRKKLKRNSVAPTMGELRRERRLSSSQTRTRGRQMERGGQPKRSHSEPAGMEPRDEGEEIESTDYVLQMFDRVVWMGDLNYRINGNRSVLDHLLGKSMYEVMLANDQLALERSRGHVFAGYSEGSIAFQPTYKYDIGTDSYDTSDKQRIPSWTDRILFADGMQLGEYNTCQSIKTSDHRPVYAKFDVGIDVTELAKGAAAADDESNATISAAKSKTCVVL